MSDPQKTAGAKNLERQLDEAFPDRRKPDGWIGNKAHQGHVSDHNPDDTPGSKPGWDGDPDNIPDVRALDISTDLGPGVTMIELVKHLTALPKLGTVVRYLIFDGLIYHVNQGFKPHTFDGDPHRDHLHVTFAWTEAADDNTTFDYRLEELSMPSAEEYAKAVWDYQLRNPYSDKDQAAGTLLRYVPSRSPHEVTQGMIRDLAAAVADLASTVKADDSATARALQDIQAKLDEISAKLDSAGGTPA